MAHTFFLVRATEKIKPVLKPPIPQKNIGGVNIDQVYLTPFQKQKQISQTIFFKT